MQKKPTYRRFGSLRIPPIRMMPSESGNVKRIEVSLCAKLRNGSLRFVDVVAGRVWSSEVGDVQCSLRCSALAHLWHNKQMMETLPRRSWKLTLSPCETEMMEQISEILDYRYILQISSTTRIFQISIGQWFWVELSDLGEENSYKNNKKYIFLFEQHWAYRTNIFRGHLISPGSICNSESYPTILIDETNKSCSGTIFR